MRGGLTRFARPAGSLFAALAVCPTGCASCRTPVGDSHPPTGLQYMKKKPVLSYELFFKYGGEGGIDSLCSPCGQPVRCALSLSNWLSPVVEPRSGGLIPPAGVQYAKKKPAFSCELFFKYGGEGGLTRFARPAGSLFAALAVCPTGCASCRTPVGDSHPPTGVQYAKKKPVLSYELFFKYGGEGGIRTPDTLPYTHFPGVLLQPLGHLTILSSRCCRDGR